MNGTNHSGAVTEDLTRARDYLHQAAVQGHVRAQRAIAAMLRSGEGGTIDLPTARFWYREAASTGDITSIRCLGWMIMSGKGGPVDLQLAADLFLWGSNMRDKECAYRYGWCLLMDAEVRRENNMYLQWEGKIRKAFSVAAGLGHRGAMSCLGTMFYTGVDGPVRTGER